MPTTQEFRARLVVGHKRLGQYLAQEAPPLVLIRDELMSLQEHVRGALHQLGLEERFFAAVGETAADYARPKRKIPSVIKGRTS